MVYRLKTKYTWCRWGCFCLVMAMLAGFDAQADEVKPRYVAGDGRDQGTCTNVFRPCRSLVYAARQAGKFDPVLAAAGQYALANLDDLVLLTTSQLKGGMDPISQFTRQDTDQFLSQLSGVPLAYRDHFNAAGFQVIVDRKSQVIAHRKLQQFQQKRLLSKADQSAGTCVAGGARGYPCQGLDLLSHLSLATLGGRAANDVWGFVDLNTGREYVLVGLDVGLAVVDVTEPQAPVVVDRYADGAVSTWRDVKVYQRWDPALERWFAYAYVSTEASTGLTILSLADLPNGVSALASDLDFRSAHNVYLVNADYSFGTTLTDSRVLLTVAGANKNNGSYRLYALDTSPVPTPLVNGNAGYMHDAASVQISDQRQLSQCINAAASPHCWLLADFNEDSFDIWDMTQVNSPQLLASVTYPDASYVHSGWWSEDGILLFVQDELDESHLGINTTLRVFDMTNLRQPELLSVWRGPTAAIDHNGFVRGNRYYMSNYLEGLTVIDLTDPGNPTRSAYFDTYPASAATAFEGAWGVYPFLPSGTLAVSDISGGLFLLKEAQAAPPPGGILSFAAKSAAGVEGDQLDLAVERLGGDQGDVSVRLDLVELVAGTGDVQLSTARLHWPDGDTSVRRVQVNLVDDGLEEGLEKLALRLVAPKGTSQLGDTSLLMLDIADRDASSRLVPLSTQITVPKGAAKAQVAIQRLGDFRGEVSVQWQQVIAADSGTDPATGTLVWPDGDSRARVLTVEIKPGTPTFSIVLANAANARLEAQEVVVTMPASGGGDNRSRTSDDSGGGPLGWVLLVLCSLCGYRSVKRGFIAKVR